MSIDVCEVVNCFPADRREVEVSLFSVVFETASAAAKAVTAVRTSCVFRGAQNLITTVLLLWQNLGPLLGPPNFWVKKLKMKASPLWQNLGPLIFVWKN